MYFVWRENLFWGKKLIYLKTYLLDMMWNYPGVTL